MRKEDRNTIIKALIVFLAVLGLGLVMSYASYAAEMSEGTPFDYKKAFNEAEEKAYADLSDLGAKYQGLMQETQNDTIGATKEKYTKRADEIVMKYSGKGGNIWTGWSDPEQEKAFSIEWGQNIIEYQFALEKAEFDFEQELNKLYENYEKERQQIYVEFWTEVGRIQDRLSGKTEDSKQSKLNRMSKTKKNARQGLHERRSLDRRTSRPAASSSCGGGHGH